MEARLVALQALFERRGHLAINRAPKSPPARFWRVCGAAKRWLLLKVWQIPTPAPKPPPKAAKKQARRGLVFEICSK